MTKPTPPHATLPLPRELRDQVFECLLNAPQTKCTVEKEQNVVEHNALSDAAKPYAFSTTLMAVNSSLAHEMTKMFYKKNTFVLVTYKSATLMNLMRAFQVPVITEGLLRTDLISTWTMKIDINLSEHSMDIFTGDSNKGQFVMLADDLQLFADALQWAALFGWEKSCPKVLRNPHIGHEQWQRVEASNYKKVAWMSVHFNSLQDAGVLGNINTKLTPELEASLLQPLMRCSCGGLVIWVTGSSTGDEQLTQRLKSIMAPHEVWLSAMAWNLLGALVKVHALIDDLYRQGRMRRVYDLCVAVADQLVMTDVFADFNFVGSNTASEPIFRSIAVATDLLIYMFATVTRSSDFDTTIKTMNRFMSLIDGCIPSLGSVVTVPGILPTPTPQHTDRNVNLMWVSMIYNTIKTLQKNVANPRAEHWFFFDRDLHGLEEYVNASPENKYMSHDFELMVEMQKKRHLPNRSGRLQAEEFVSKLSFNHFGPFSIKTEPAYKFQIPPQMQGFVDMDEAPKLAWVVEQLKIRNQIIPA